MNKEEYEQIYREMKISEDMARNMAVLREHKMTQEVERMKNFVGLSFAPLVCKDWPALLMIANFKEMRVIIYAIPPRYVHVAGDFFTTLIRIVVQKSEEKMGFPLVIQEIEIQPVAKSRPELN